MIVAFNNNLILLTAIFAKLGFPYFLELGEQLKIKYKQNFFKFVQWVWFKIFKVVTSTQKL